MRGNDVVRVLRGHGLPGCLPAYPSGGGGLQRRSHCRALWDMWAGGERVLPTILHGSSRLHQLTVSPGLWRIWQKSNHCQEYSPTAHLQILTSSWELALLLF